MVFRLDGCSFDYSHTWSKSGFSILVKAFGYIKRVVKSDLFFGKRPCLHHTCATLNEQPSNIKTMSAMVMIASAV